MFLRTPAKVNLFLEVLGRRQVLVAAAYRDVGLPVQVPEYDALRGEVSSAPS